MKLSKEEVFELAKDFKKIVIEKQYDANLMEIDLRLLSLRCCVEFTANYYNKECYLVKETVTSVHKNHIVVTVEEKDDGKTKRLYDKHYPLDELPRFTYRLGETKTVMSEIGKFYKNKRTYKN